MNYYGPKSDIVHLSKHLYNKGLVTGYDGNISFKNIKSKLIFTSFNYEDLKEVTTIIVRLLKTSLTTILKRIFEIRNES